MGVASRFSSALGMERMPASTASSKIGLAFMAVWKYLITCWSFSCN